MTINTGYMPDYESQLLPIFVAFARNPRTRIDVPPLNSRMRINLMGVGIIVYDATSLDYASDHLGDSESECTWVGLIASKHTRRIV